MASLTPRRTPRRYALAACSVVLFLGIFGALLAAKSSGTLHPPLTREQAEAAAVKNREVRRFVERSGYTDVKALALDETHWRITLFDHGRTVLDASVGPTGRVDAVQGHLPGIHATGSNILWNRPLMFGLALLFVVATGVAPLRRIRNLDALVIAGGSLVFLLLYDARLVAADAYAGAALLAYATSRCAWTGLRPTAERAPATPLYAAALARVPAESRKRIATAVCAALLFAGALITVTSTGISDVAFAGLAGATSIQRGDPPYGHVTHEVVHGDTYPIVTYVLYLPFSLAGPVDDSFDNLDGALWLNALALVAAALLAYVLGKRASPGGSRAHGLALATAWLACPAVLMAASGGGNDIPTATLVMAGLAFSASAVLGSGALALATAAKLGPAAALLAYVCSLRGRPRVVAAVVAVAIGLASVLLVVALGGAGAISQMVDALAFQFRRGSFHSLWTQIGSSAAQAAFQALVITYVIVVSGALATSREPWPFARVAAVGGAGVLGLQLAANYWTFAYFVWALPFILVALFPPAHPRFRQSAPRAP